MSLRPLLLAGLLALAGCAGQIGNTFRPAVYEVRPGDTLYSIAWRYGLDHRELQRWNDLDSPDLLRVGQELHLRPDADADADADAGAQRSASRERQAPGARAPQDDGGEAATARAAPEWPSSAADDAESAGEPGEWHWPAAGRLVGRFGEEGVAGRGIELAGEQGSPIAATAAGEVVYSGEGLQAYGQLVIIRHGDAFLSAYAHNDHLLVSEGQQVTAGQQIAAMGKTNNGRVLLHFEIRRQGTPVDPLDFLPARD